MTHFPTSMTSPKLMNTTAGSYDDEDFSPPPYYGSPIITGSSLYSTERRCATVSAQPRYVTVSKDLELPRIRKAPACEELTMVGVPRTVSDDENEACDDEDDTLYFVPGLSGVYSPNEWAQLARFSPPPSLEQRCYRRSLMHDNSFDQTTSPALGDKTQFRPVKFAAADDDSATG